MEKLWYYGKNYGTMETTIVLCKNYGTMENTLVLRKKNYDSIPKTMKL